MIIGKHLIAGHWQDSDDTFRSDPYSGVGREYAQGRVSDVNQAAELAAAAFISYSRTSASARSQLLECIASQMEANRDTILRICCDETGLQETRAASEFARTVNQLRFFASYILNNDYLDIRRDSPLPDRSPLPRPDLRMIQRPLGPVAVFGASNFPLAFSTAGGDTAAALAAGCPVVVKGHSAHPGTGDCVAQCIAAALEQTGIHSGVFSQIQSNSFDAGQSLVRHPCIKAVGFTGSTKGGRYLFDLCAARPEPIPFYGELGSINPVFVFSGAFENRWKRIASEWIASFTLSAGQLCTNPGVLIMPATSETDAFIDLLAKELQRSPLQTMLSDDIAQSYREGHDRVRDCSDTVVVRHSECQRRRVTPAIYRTTAQAWLENEFLSDEIFGPLGQVVIAHSTDEIFAIANALSGQLTCSIHMADSDAALADQLLAIVEHKAGRIVFNGFPTGVEVCDAMVHGGPYPASTNFGATSVGSLSIRRFLRPVCFQDIPDSIYPF